MTKISFAPFQAEHVPQAVALSNRERWGHRSEDWNLLLRFSSGIVALSGGDVVGTAMRSDFGTGQSRLSMVITREDMRGLGVGRQMVEALLDDSRVFRLTATAQGRPLYEKLGFRQFEQLSKHVGTVRSPDSVSENIQAYHANDKPHVQQLEAEDFGADRTAFVNVMTEIGDLAVARDISGDIIGYAAVRPFDGQFTLGPICAPDLGTARDLTHYFAKKYTGKVLRVDTFAKLGLGAHLENIGLAHQGDFALMQRGNDSANNPRYGVFSQAIG